MLRSNWFFAALMLALAACSTATPVPETQSPLSTRTSTPFVPQVGEDDTATPTETPTTLPTTEQACNDPAEGSGFPRYARLMHDSQWMPWPSRIADPEWPRGFSLDWYPETVPLWVNPRSGDGSVLYSREWLEFLRALQPNDEAAVWIARIAAGLFNRGNLEIPILDLDQMEEEPRAEGISSGGNVVKVLETRSGSARIEMLFLDDGPPDLADISYQEFPWLITKFTSVSVKGEVGNAGGIDVYFPNVANRECGYWVDLQRVEFFPQLPFGAVTEQDLSIFDESSSVSRKVGAVTEGRNLTILEYLPQGSDVWGRTEDGWVLLLYQIQGQPIYTTTWTMATRPPILIP